MGEQIDKQKPEESASQVERLLEADILVNKFRHLINHITLMSSSRQHEMVGKVNEALDDYFFNGGKFIVNDGF